jgi:two-component system, NarL family, invasion response regulator UvrY
MIRLFIADDHPIVREGLRHVIARSHDITVVGEAADAESLLRGLRGTVADVLLLDVTMPGPGILEIVAVIKEAHPRLRVLVLSVHPEELYARRVLKAGADGYLTKTQSSEALASAIRQVHAGGKYVSPSLAQTLAVDLARKEGDAHQNLSNREYQVFLEIGSGSGVAQIAQQLRLSPKTVRTYRSRILEKMNLQSTAELIFYAVSHELVSRPVDRAGDRPDRVPVRAKRRTVASARKTKR